MLYSVWAHVFLHLANFFISLGYDSPVPEHSRNSPVRGYSYARSGEALIQSHAHEQRPMSREATQGSMAREAYYQSRQPAHNNRDVSRHHARYDSHANVRTALTFTFHLLDVVINLFFMKRCYKEKHIKLSIVIFCHHINCHYS
jgi:hypothetical protein